MNHCRQQAWLILIDMFMCVNCVRNNMAGKKRLRTKEEDVRDVLLELCRHSGSSEHTVTGLAEKLHINKGSVSTAIQELRAHIELAIGYHGAHQITLKHDIPTLELFYMNFDGDFRAQAVVMKSNCFRDAAMITFDQFCKTISDIRYNIYRTWESYQPATPEEQKIFDDIRRDTTRAHVFEPSLRFVPELLCHSGLPSDPLKTRYQRIAPPDTVGGVIEITEADRIYIK